MNNWNQATFVADSTVGVSVAPPALVRAPVETSTIELVDESEEDPAKKYEKVLQELRSFLIFGGQQNGRWLSIFVRWICSLSWNTFYRATTSEILMKFGNRIALQDSVVFKTMLQKICDFERLANGEGVWVLKTDYRWLFLIWIVVPLFFVNFCCVCYILASKNINTSLDFIGYVKFVKTKFYLFS